MQIILDDILVNYIKTGPDWPLCVTVSEEDLPKICSPFTQNLLNMDGKVMGETVIGRIDLSVVSGGTERGEAYWSIVEDDKLGSFVNSPSECFINVLQRSGSWSSFGEFLKRHIEYDSQKENPHSE